MNWRPLSVVATIFCCLLLVQPAFSAVQQTPRIYPVLKKESHGNDVKRLQARLNNVLKPSPNLGIDGKFGAKTHTAVVRFQKKMKLNPDGTVGTKCWSRLYAISVGPKVTVSFRALETLRQLLDKASLKTAHITSGTRTPYDQTRVMYANLVEYGTESQYKLYGPNGDQVIDVYVANKAKKAKQVITLMQARVISLGPSNVSKHCSNTHDVIDVGPSSITNRKKFESAITWSLKHRLISHAILPPADPAYHIEIRR